MTLADSVEPALPTLLFVGLREFARIRNKLAHKERVGRSDIPSWMANLAAAIADALERGPDTCNGSQGSQSSQLVSGERPRMKDMPTIILKTWEEFGEFSRNGENNLGDIFETTVFLPDELKSAQVLRAHYTRFGFRSTVKSAGEATASGFPTRLMVLYE